METLSKEKQIEEMASFVCSSFHGHHDCENCSLYEERCCVSFGAAKRLYNAGYRKQEWISVAERLPEPNADCLVAAKVGNRMVVDLGSREWCFDYRTMEHSYVWSIMNDWDEGEGCEITHWMPLPEAPKMRKEDEGK